LYVAQTGKLISLRESCFQNEKVPKFSFPAIGSTGAAGMHNRVLKKPSGFEGAANPPCARLRVGASHIQDREGIMNIIRPALAAALIGLSALATPALAGKRDNSIRFADERVVPNLDNYFNQDAVGTIFAEQVWDTLIYL
jgi:hypothetical protein